MQREGRGIARPGRMKMEAMPVHSTRPREDTLIILCTLKPVNVSNGYLIYSSE